MKINKIQKGLVLASIAAGVLAAGCELVVDFDRTRIPVEVAEASIPDANVSDSPAPVEAGNEDAGTDADASDLGDADASDLGDGSTSDADAAE